MESKVEKAEREVQIIARQEIRDIQIVVDPVRVLSERVDLIRRVQQEVMRPGVDYGTIPGCGDKPTLLKPGAEKLMVTFGLCPRVHQEDHLETNGHLTINTRVELLDKAGNFLGEGIGSCSTRESKYRYRQGTRKCPACGKESIIRGKAEYGGGWLCWTKKDGCGAKFSPGDQTIEKQNVGRIENADLADSYNTVRKISAKRARVDACMSVTGVSDLFTQDIEDFRNEDDAIPPEAAPVKSPAKQEQASPESGKLLNAKNLFAKLRAKNPGTHPIEEWETIEKNICNGTWNIDQVVAKLADQYNALGTK